MFPYHNAHVIALYIHRLQTLHAVTKAWGIVASWGI